MTLDVLARATDGIRGMTIRILIADDHGLVRAGVRGLLSRQPDFQVVGEAEDGLTAVKLALDLRPDVIVCDVSMPVLGGAETTRRILGEWPDARIISLSVHHESTIVCEMLKAGASAYVSKNSMPDELVLAVRAVHRGEMYVSPKIAHVILAPLLASPADAQPSAFTILTPKEREVLQLIAEGRSNKEVADTLCISVKAVEARRAQIMEKLQIHTVAGLTKYAVREGLTSLDI
jgi:DNA-binding NarL/FixJ family response regulator